MQRRLVSTDTARAIHAAGASATIVNTEVVERGSTEYECETVTQESIAYEWVRLPYVAPIEWADAPEKLEEAETVEQERRAARGPYSSRPQTTAR
jgi:hypothetical protein